MDRPPPLPSTLRVDGDGHPVTAFVGGPGGDAPLVIAVHGITANAAAFAPLARRLTPTVNVVAVDLRGRGASGAHPGPYGLAAHAADVWRLADALGCERPVLVGHSMGAYVVARAAVGSPDRVRHLVLLDGGLPLTDGPPDDPDAVLEATIGPALARLALAWPRFEDALGFWRSHPALQGRHDLDEVLTAYVAHDLGAGPGSEGPVRSRVSPTAVSHDGRELLVDPAAAGAAATTEVPTTLVRASRGLLDDPDSPLIDPASRDAFRARRPEVTVVELPGHLNHYTMLWDEAGLDAIADLVGSRAGSEPL